MEETQLALIALSHDMYKYIINKCLLKESMKTKPVNEPVWFRLGVFVTSNSHNIPDSGTVAERELKLKLNEQCDCCKLMKLPPH